MPFLGMGLEMPEMPQPFSIMTMGSSKKISFTSDRVWSLKEKHGSECTRTECHIEKETAQK